MTPNIIPAGYDHLILFNDYKNRQAWTILEVAQTLAISTSMGEKWNFARADQAILEELLIKYIADDFKHLCDLASQTALLAKKTRNVRLIRHRTAATLIAPKFIRWLREEVLKESVQTFADRFGRSKATVQNWQGRSEMMSYLTYMRQFWLLWESKRPTFTVRPYKEVETSTYLD